MFVGILVTTLDMNNEGAQSPNIVLTGFMGTGKSTVGRLLARRLAFTFLDLDELIEKEAGMPIKEIFSSLGESHFRELESEAIRKLSSGGFGERLVVSTGGGAVMKPENRSRIRSWGRVVCLAASNDEILRRVGNRPERPLLYGPDREEKMARLLAERREAYLGCDIEIDTTGLKPEEVVAIIRRFLSGQTKGRTLSH